jgi:hypothetical protein
MRPYENKGNTLQNVTETQQAGDSSPRLIYLTSPYLIEFTSYFLSRLVMPALQSCAGSR